MSADLRLTDLMDEKFIKPGTDPTSVASVENVSGVTWKTKLLIGSILAAGLAGGVIWAMAINAEKRPDIDNTGKSMSIVIDDQSDSPNSVVNLESKLKNPNVITNYFNDHPPEKAEHPLDPALVVARRGLKHLRSHIKDFTTTLHKQERIGKKLLPKEIIESKLRHNDFAEGEEQSPASVYVKFLEPKEMSGREVIWQKGRNNDRLTVHEYTFIGNKQLDLDPNGFFAMRGNRYPITEVGLEVLLLRMIEKGERDRKHAECEVKIDRSTKLNGRDCTLIEIIHPVERKHFEFHIAKIYIDDELNVPISYAAWTWPKEPGGEPVLEEQYVMADLKINVGLTDKDFDVTNENYEFPNK